jgi:hypothetical protein
LTKDRVQWRIFELCYHTVTWYRFIAEPEIAFVPCLYSPCRVQELIIRRQRNVRKNECKTSEAFIHSTCHIHAGKERVLFWKQIGFSAAGQDQSEGDYSNVCSTRRENKMLQGKTRERNGFLRDGL